MKQPGISVAMCTLNGARHLGEQLDSLLRQTQRPHELVVCDDGSTDGTLSVLDGFSRRATFPVRVERNERRLGVAANFSRAIGLCSGSVIALSDQDDVWREYKLERLAEVFRRDPAAVLAFSDAVAVDDSAGPLGYRLWDAVMFSRSERAWARDGRLLDVLVRHNVVTGATLAFRADLRDLLLPIPPDVQHDAWIGLLLAAAGACVAIEDPLISYRQHPTQTSGGERILSLRAQAARAREQTESHLLHVAGRYAQARDRLAASGRGEPVLRAARLLDGKVAHASARAAMRRPGTRRLPLVLREIFSGRYARYSDAWKFIAADLFL